MSSVTTQRRPGRKRPVAPAVLALAPWALAAMAASAWWANRKETPPPQPLRVEPKPQPGLSRQTQADPAHFEAQEPGRGRMAVAPAKIPWRGWKDILWRTYREMGHDRLNVVAGSVTYYTLLAIFPALGVFVSLVLWGAALGVLVPFVHRPLHADLEEVSKRSDVGPAAAAANGRPSR